MRTILGIAGLALEDFHDGEADVEADQIAESQRAHRMIGTELHGSVDAFDGGDALGVDADGLVDHRDQDTVDNEAGGFLDMDRNLAHLLGDLNNLVNRLGGGVLAGDDFDQLHDGGRIEEMHADNRMLHAVGNLGDRERGGVGAENHTGLAELVELSKDVLLDLHILSDGLEDKVNIGNRFDLGGGSDAGIDLIGGSLLHLALGNSLVESLLHVAHRLVEGGLLAGSQNDLIAGLSKRIGNAGAHGTGAKYTNFHSSFPPFCFIVAAFGFFSING